MQHTNTVIIGGGQAGLAVSRGLIERNIEHVILERGRIGERWRSERWDSLRLLSPNWMARLPHYEYTGDKPDDFMSMPEFIRYLEQYAESFEAPIVTGTSVEGVDKTSSGRYIVSTNRGQWSALNVVVATGFCDTPRVPEFAKNLPTHFQQIVPSDYRNPEQIMPGGVLVVGASATGVQIAEELILAGRSVTVAVGTHVRWPRRYRGKDMLHWMVNMGAFNAPANPAEERQSPPPQLVGTPDNRDLDLGVLQKLGARLVGHAMKVEADQVHFADDLADSISSANTQLTQVLEKVDGYIESTLSDDLPPLEVIEDIPVPMAPTEINLSKEGINTLIWATGYNRRYPWLNIPVLDERGDIIHNRGVTPEAGLYVIGMRFQTCKGSNLIDGVGADAIEVSENIAKRQDTQAA